MAEKKIVKQSNGYIIYDDKSKETIADYRKRMNLKPLKKDVDAAVKKSEGDAVKK